VKIPNLTEDKIDDVKDSFCDELRHISYKLPKYHMKILLWGFNAKVGREDVFEPIVGNESLQEISNENGARVVNFATSKYLIVKSAMSSHCNIHQYTWMSPDGKTDEINHIQIDRQRHSCVPDV
jgi:hypothetical protein